MFVSWIKNAWSYLRHLFLIEEYNEMRKSKKTTTFPIKRDLYAESTRNSAATWVCPSHDFLLTVGTAADHLVPSPTEGSHGLSLPPWASISDSPKLLGLSPLTRNPHLPSLAWGASVVVVWGLGRGRRVRFDGLGAEERKLSVTTDSVVQVLWIITHGSAFPNTY